MTTEKTVIQTQREKRGWTQRQLAGFVGATYSVVSLWERLDRKRRPNPGFIGQLAALFQIDKKAIEDDYPKRERKGA